MIWLDSIDQLQYYHQPAGLPCYCEPVIEPNDLLLQAIIPSFISSDSLTVKIEVMSGDGITIYEDASSYFEWYLFQGNDGGCYMNMRLIKYSPAMCAHGCFILRVTITNNRVVNINGDTIPLFRKYTERYCVDNCCSLPGDINIDVNDGTPQDGEYDPADYGNEYYNIN